MSFSPFSHALIPTRKDENIIAITIAKILTASSISRSVKPGASNFGFGIWDLGLIRRGGCFVWILIPQSGCVSSSTQYLVLFNDIMFSAISTFSFLWFSGWSALPVFPAHRNAILLRTSAEKFHTSDSRKTPGLLPQHRCTGL